TPVPVAGPRFASHTAPAVRVAAAACRPGGDRVAGQRAGRAAFQMPGRVMDGWLQVDALGTRVLPGTALTGRPRVARLRPARGLDSGGEPGDRPGLVRRPAQWPRTSVRSSTATPSSAPTAMCVPCTVLSVRTWRWSVSVARQVPAAGSQTRSVWSV